MARLERHSVQRLTSESAFSIDSPCGKIALGGLAAALVDMGANIDGVLKHDTFKAGKQ